MESSAQPEIHESPSALDNATSLLKNTMGVTTEDRFGIIANHLTDFEALFTLAQATRNLGITPTILYFNDGEIKPETMEHLHGRLDSLGLSMTELDYPDTDSALQNTSLKCFQQTHLTAAVRIASDCVELSNRIAEIGTNDGIAIAEMPGLTQTDLSSPVFAELPEHMRARERELLNILKDAVSIRISDTLGTDLTIGLDSNEPWVSDPDDFTKRGVGAPIDNLPGREIYKNPIPHITNGKIVLHHLDSYVDPNVEVDQPVVLTFSEGKIIAIEGGDSAEKLKQYLKDTMASDSDPDAWRYVSEVAFGLNFKTPHYDKDKVSTLVGEKAPTFHFAIGDTPNRDKTIQQLISSDVHLDFVLDKRYYQVEITHRDGTKEIVFGTAGRMDNYS
jgi:hypothetical protein